MVNINGSVEINQRSKDNNKELVLKENKDKDENNKNPKNDKKDKKDSNDLKGEDVEEKNNRVDET